MVMVRKREPAEHLVAVDTSILWHQDKGPPVNPAFDVLWEQYAQEFKLSLLIPETVRGELLFQQATSATKAMERATKALAEVSSVVAGRYSHRATKGRVREKVAAKLDRWIAARRGTVLPTPADEIDWHELIRRSIWRESPFLFDPKDGDNEKGFRDALILETVAQRFSEESGKTKLVFLCGDGLLRGATDDRLRSNHRYDSYESLADFETYLKLTREQLEADFVRALIRKASRKFFDKQGQDGLYYAEGVKDQLHSKYEEYFENPQATELSGVSAGLAGLRRSRVPVWEKKQGGMFWVSNAQFVEIDSDVQYVWSSPVTFVQLWSQVFPSRAVSLFGATHEREKVLILPFKARWRAKVTKDGRFRSPEVLDFKLEEPAFRPPTSEDTERWRLKVEEEAN